METSGRVSHWAGVLTCQLGSSSVWLGSSDSSSSCLILATRPRIESAPLSNWSAFESSNSVSLALTSRIIASFSIVLVLGSLTTGEQLRVGAQSGLGPSPGWGPVRVGAHMGPYGPIWAHMGPCGPIWAHMGPPGQVLEKASTFRQLSVETFGPISHDSDPKMVF